MHIRKFQESSAPPLVRADPRTYGLRPRLWFLISINKTSHVIHWIVIYPVESVIHLSNNRAQLYKKAAGHLGGGGGWRTPLTPSP